MYKDLTGKVLRSHLELGPPYPQIVLNTNHCVEWQEVTEDAAGVQHSSDEAAWEVDWNCNMRGLEHINLHAFDQRLGPILLSLRDVDSDPGLKMTHVILRMSMGTFQQHFPEEETQNMSDLVRCSVSMCPDLQVDAFVPIISRRASSLIAEFDEKSGLFKREYTFGILYQKFGQTTEDEILGNREHSRAFDEFLDHLGERAQIQHLQNFIEELECHGIFEVSSIRTRYRERQVSFMVPSMFIQGTAEQAKRRLLGAGSSPVMLVFQDTNTPFSPEVVKTEKLRVFIIVQPAGEADYRVSVVANINLPYFGPALPAGGLVPRGRQFTEFIFSKLINADSASLNQRHNYRRMSSMEQRSRTSMLSEIIDSVSLETHNYISGSRMNSMDESLLGGKDKKFFQAMKALIGKRSQSLSAGHHRPPPLHLATSPVSLHPDDGGLALTPVSPVSPMFLALPSRERQARSQPSSPKIFRNTLSPGGYSATLLFQKKLIRIKIKTGQNFFLNNNVGRALNSGRHTQQLPISKVILKFYIEINSNMAHDWSFSSFHQSHVGQ